MMVGKIVCTACGQDACRQAEADRCPILGNDVTPRPGSGILSPWVWIPAIVFWTIVVVVVKIF